MTTAQERLDQILLTWYELLTQWSLDGSLVAAATDALVLDSTNAKEDAQEQLQSLVSQWSVGDFSALPPIVLLSDADISGAQGAYAASTGTIYLNQEWLLTASDEQIQRVLTEELGHSLDDQLNLVDTRGDEGFLFSLRLAKTSVLTDIALASQDTQNDNILIAIDNLFVEAEASANSNEDWIFTTADYMNIVKSLSLNDGSILISSSYGSGGSNGIIDISGNYRLAGDLSVDGGTPTSIDLNGNVLTTGDYGYAVILGGQYFQGIPFRPNSYAAEYDKNGDYKWSIHASSYSDVNFNAVFRDEKDSSLYLAGNFLGESFFGSNTLTANGDSDAFYAKVGVNGEYEWFRTISGVGSQSIQQLEMLPNGQLRAVINYYGETLLGSDFSFNSTIYGSGKKLIAIINPDGSFADAFSVQGDAELGIRFFGDGSFVYAGQFEIGACSADGSPLWSYKLPLGFNDRFNDFEIVNDESIVFIGGFQGSLTLGEITISQSTDTPLLEFGNRYDGYVGSLTKSGSVEWLKAINSADANDAMSVEVNEAGNIFVTGFYFNDMYFDGAYIAPAQVLDVNSPLQSAYVLKLYSDGRLVDKNVVINENNLHVRDSVYQLNTAIELTGSAVEGSELVFDFNISAGSEQRKDLVEGVHAYWLIDGITQSDTSLTSLSGMFTVVNGTYSLSFSLLDDGVYEEEALTIRLFSDALFTDQIGEQVFFNIEDTSPRYIAGTASLDTALPVYISGGLDAPVVEQLEVVKSGKGKNVKTTYTWTETLVENASGDLDVMIFNAGSANNIITGAGFIDDASTLDVDETRLAFTGVLVIDGKEGVDRITGGTTTNWLIGGGVAGGSIDTLTGTATAKDIFDLRQSTVDGLWFDAYSTGGNAVVNNFDPLKDLLVLSGDSYTYRPKETPVYKGKRLIGTTIGGFEILDASNKLVASVSGTGFTDTNFAKYLVLGQNEQSPFDVTLPDGTSIV